MGRPLRSSYKFAVSVSLASTAVCGFCVDVGLTGLATAMGVTALGSTLYLAIEYLRAVK